MPLYHFSEEADIRRFRPRIAPTSQIQHEPLVWAIDEWHAPMYFFPRNCPRACFWPGPETTTEDREHWFAGIEARMVIVVESAWFERIRSATLYRYRMPESSFELLDPIAGHWVSKTSVVPRGVEIIDDLLGSLIESGVELRITPDLLDLWSLIIQSTLQFSGTRLRNARQQGAGFAGATHSG